MEVKTQGDNPTGDVLFASCDSNYFLNHGPAFMMSAIKFKQNLHLHIVNPDKHVNNIVERVSKFNNLTFSTEQTDLKGIDPRTYYACNRFIVAPYILRQAHRVMILDVDNYLMNEMRWPDSKYDAGLFLRDPLPGTSGWEQESTHVAAGIVYLDMRKAISFAIDVSNKLKESKNFVWFVDQNVLWKCYNKWKDKLNILSFERHIMDWEFKHGTMLWTGKGPRKYNNKTYVDQKDRYTKELYESLHT